ncbi:E3 ubiquitin-protein ligase rnf14 [Chytriomyces hyalinus]|nr:E3 ubiquitin-protein ligase rnf14 [Chytriomyces hyalinus]
MTSNPATSEMDANESELAANAADQIDELESLRAIFSSDSEPGTVSWNGVSPVVGRVSVRVQLGDQTEWNLTDDGNKMTHSIRSLPPISLLFALPSTYPSHAPPSLAVTADWLSNKQRHLLTNQLVSIANNSPNCPILFELVCFIQSESAQFLGLVDTENNTISLDKDSTDSNTIETILEHDRKHRDQLFANETITCGICLDSKLGANSFRFSTCGHAYCKVCLVDYFTIHITEKNVLQVTCPSSSCKKEPNAASRNASVSSVQPLPPHTLTALLPAPLIEKYESLLKMHDLLQKPNLTYCPRQTCQAPTLKDPDEEKLCICPECSYAFCFFCNRTWHGYAAYCQIRHLSVVAAEYAAADESKRSVMEIKYGKKLLEKAIRELEEDKLNSAWMKDNAQACPNCRVMTCMTCGTHFCFLCGQHLNKSNPYQHYNTRGSSCYGKLFEGAIIRNDAAFGEEGFGGENELVADGGIRNGPNVGEEAVAAGNEVDDGIEFQDFLGVDDLVVDEQGFVMPARWRRTQ